MSAKNRSDLLSNGYYRNSFDRFGDDLCVEILQYLSFCDKIRFECVSKQWKRCVYQRQYILESHNKFRFINLLPVNNLYAYPKRLAKYSPKDFAKRITNFERVLQKCSKINCIEVCDINEYNRLDDLIRIIINNCYHLKSFTVHSYDAIGCEISNTTLNDFCLKFGKTLKQIRFGTSMDTEFYNVIQFCTNIESVSTINVKHLASGDISLQKLSIVKHVNGCDDIELMKRFAAKYRNTIKVFEAEYMCGNICVEFMSQLSQLNKLEKLKVYFDWTSSLNLLDLANGLELLAVNCKLKRLSLRFEHQSNDNDSNQLLKVINRFTELRSLKVSSLKTTAESIELLIDCKQLTKLVFEFICGDKLFEHIDKIFPKLTKISVKGKIFTDEALNYLSNLEHLRVVSMKTFYDSLVTQTGICNLIEKCQKFRRFSFNKCPIITKQTIRALIEFANRRPHIKFNHGFGYCSPIKHYILVSSVKTYGRLPSNLKIRSKVHNLCIKY